VVRLAELQPHERPHNDAAWVQPRRHLHELRRFRRVDIRLCTYPFLSPRFPFIIPVFSPSPLPPPPFPFTQTNTHPTPDIHRRCHWPPSRLAAIPPQKPRLHLLHHRNLPQMVSRNHHPRRQLHLLPVRHRRLAREQRGDDLPRGLFRLQMRSRRCDFRDGDGTELACS